jgi:hypothetical protein
MRCDAENDESAESYDVHLVAWHSSNLQVARLVVSVPLDRCYFSLVWSRSLTRRRGWTSCLSSRVCSNTGNSCVSLSLSNKSWPEFSSFSGFYTGATVNLTQDDVVLNSVVKSVTEHWRKEHGEG